MFLRFKLLIFAIGYLLATSVEAATISIVSVDSSAHTARLAFDSSEAARPLYFASGSRDWGDQLADWPAVGITNLATVAAGLSHCEVELPPSWGTTGNAFGRFFFAEVERYPVDAYLDYIQGTRGSAGSDGCCIKTGLYPNQTSKVVMDFTPTANSYSQTLFCARTSTSDPADKFVCFLLNTSGGYMRYDYRSPGSSTQTSWAPNTRYVFSNDCNTAYIWQYETPATTRKSMTGGNSAGTAFTSGYEMLLFMTGAPSSSATDNAGTFKLYGFKMWTDGVLVADYVPAISGSVAGVCDRVSGQFKSSSQTRQFVAGPARAELPAEFRQHAVSRLVTSASAEAGKLSPGAYCCSAVIKVPGYVKSAELARFPLLVRLSEGSPAGFSYDDCAADGADLRFTDAEGNLIAHEVDTWNPAGESCVWVLMPSLNATDALVTMYWSPRQGLAATALSPTAVWVDYVGVWHMGEKDGIAKDSTANHLDGTSVKAIDGGFTSKVGRSSQVAGANGVAYSTGVSQLTAATLPQPLANAAYLSCSGWMKSRVSGNEGRVLFMKGGWVSDGGWYLNVASAGITTFLMVGGSTNKALFSVPNCYTDWVYFDGVYNSTTFAVYANGEVRTRTDSSALSAAKDNANYQLTIGQINGYLDEFRIRNGVTTAERAYADYATQADPSFVAFGSVVCESSPIALTAQSIGAEDSLSLSLAFGLGAEAGDKVVFCRGYDEGAAVGLWETSNTVATLSMGSGEALQIGPFAGFGDSWRFARVYLVGPGGELRGAIQVLERHCEPRGTVGEVSPTQNSVSIGFTLDDCGAGFSTADVYLSCVEKGHEHTSYLKQNLTPLAAGDAITLSAEALPIFSDVDYSIRLDNGVHTNYLTGAFRTLPVVATGGDVIMDALDASGDKVHKFTTTGSATFTMPAVSGGVVRYLVIGGGGGGGSNSTGNGAGGGGGGAGGFVEGEVYVGAGETVNVTVGAGGGSMANGSDSKIQTAGGDDITVSKGGGHGGSRGQAGTAGGNGGGGGGRTGLAGGASTQIAPDGETVVGYPGGKANTSGFDGGGGGGGAGGAGQDGGTYDGVKRGGNGGDGAPSEITGERVYYAAGGGGGSGEGSSGTAAGSGGRGGGGNGECSSTVKTAGTANTGSGGGGTRGYSGGAAGGSGIVILRYTPVSGYQAARFAISNVKCTSLDITGSIDFLAYPDDRCSATLRYGDRYGELGAPIVLTNDWGIADGAFVHNLAGLSPDTAYRYEISFASQHGTSVTSGEFTTPKDVAVGGDFTYELDDGSVVHLFRQTGREYVFTMPTKPLMLEYLIVGGGGGGGNFGASGGAGGGGGAGGVLTGKVAVAANSTITVTVGAGGGSEAHGSNTTVSFSEGAIAGAGLNWVAVGGGQGGHRSTDGIAGGNGGGGGGRAGSYGGSALQTNLVGEVIGHKGGRANTASWDGGGGGGGAGADGQDAGTYDSVKRGGNGGDGIESFITGESVWYGGGGGGGSGEGSSGTVVGLGGRGGGGNGAAISVSPQVAIAALANTGGGGGGSRGSGNGAAGGSGIVVFRYRPAGYSAKTSFALLDNGQGYVRVRATLSSVGDGASSADWYIVWNREGEDETEFTQVATNATEGATIDYLVTGLDPLQECNFRAKMVTDIGKTVYSGASFSADEHTISSDVPVMENMLVALTDPLNGIVTCSADVPWGGDSSSIVALKFKFGRKPGVYTREVLIDGPDLGAMGGTTVIKTGRWYCVLVAESTSGKSSISSEYLFNSQYSKYTIFYLK